MSRDNTLPERVPSMPVSVQGTIRAGQISKRNMAPQGPYKLCTVNNAPERAKMIVGRVVEDLKDRYTIIHAGNAESPEAAKAVFEEIMPDVVFTASMWTPEQSSKVLAEAKEVNPKVKTLALPQGLQVQKGPDGVVEYIKEQLPLLIES